MRRWGGTDLGVGFVRLPGVWIDRVRNCKPPKIIVLDLGSSENLTWGVQEGPAYNCHFGFTCYHLLFCFNQFGDAFDFTGADFSTWCEAAGFKRTEVLHLNRPCSADIAYK